MKTKFPKISDTKIKEGIFVGPQIRALIFDANFDATMDDREFAAWNALRRSVVDCWENTKQKIT